MDINMNKEKVVLVVDDVFENLLILKKMLEKCGYVPMTASSAKDALDMIKIKMPEIILLDVYMPEMDGFELCEILKSDVKTKDIPIVFISAGMSEEDKVKGFSLGAVDFINKPFALQEVSLRVNNHVKMYEMQKNMESYNKNLNKLIQDHAIKIKEEQRNSLISVLKMYYLRYPKEEKRLANIAYNCKFLAQALEFTTEFESQITPSFLDCISGASKLHDIGKLSIGPGGDKDLHELNGGKYLEELSFLSEYNDMIKLAIEVTKAHNEKWDGSGKPLGLKGNDIPLSARILAICNRFEYLCIILAEDNPDISEEEMRAKAVETIEKESGSRFDPEVTKIFVQISKQFSLPQM